MATYYTRVTFTDGQVREYRLPWQASVNRTSGILHVENTDVRGTTSYSSSAWVSHEELWE